MVDTFVWLLLALALVAANLPFFSERILFIWAPKGEAKAGAYRVLEWLLLYFLMGAIAIGIEIKANGEAYAQDWEFYAVTACLFLVFALPGFIYRFELKHLLERR